MSKFAVFLVPAISFLLLFSVPARAFETPWSVADHVRGRLLTAADTVDDSGALQALLELELEEGWHTYWRNPGDAGLPPQLDWSGSGNISGIEIFWPVPVRKRELDFQTFAYVGSVRLPLQIGIAGAGRPAQILLKAQVMVCKDICVPQALSFTLDVPAGDGALSVQAQAVMSARAALPLPDNTEDLAIEGAVAGPKGFVITAHSSAGFENTDVFVTIGDLALTAVPEFTTITQDGKKALITLAPPPDHADLPAFLPGKEARILLVSGGRAVDRIVKF